MAKAKKIERSFSVLQPQAESQFTVSDIEVRYAFEEVQPISQGGIAFRLSLENQSDKAKLIFNPLDFFQVTIQDEEGWPLQLPITTPNRHLINSAEPAEIVRPFQVEVSSSHTDPSELEEMVEQEKFTLEPHTTYTYDILIDKVMKLDKNDPVARTTETQPLTAGKYKVKLRVSILLGDKGEINQTSESEQVEVELK